MSQKRSPQDQLPRSQRQRLLLRLLRRPGHPRLKRLLPRVHPADIAQLFPLLAPHEQQPLLLTLFELRLAASTLRELDAETQAQALAQLADPHLAVILGRLPTDDAVDLLVLLDEARQERLLSLLDPHLATHLDNLKRFGQDTAGGMMNPEVASFAADLNVSDTLDEIRHMASSDRFYHLYITDRRNHLLGIVNLWQLVVSHGDTPLRDIMQGDVLQVRTDTPRHEVAKMFLRYSLVMVPVVDEDGRLVGVITVDDALDAVEEEATEDLFRLANVDTLEGVATPALRSARLRLPWLLANLLMGLLAVTVVMSFRGTIAKVAVLAVFIPLIANMGNSAGAQTLAVLVRGLAKGDMDWRSTATVILRQLAVGLFTGGAIGLVLGIVVWLWQGNLVLAAILVFAMVMNHLTAGFLGAAVPLLLRRLNLDPAQGSSILVSTVTNLTGFLIFLGLASFLIRYLE